LGVKEGGYNMRVVTYSQDLIFTDEALLNGLIISCGKIWLPHRGFVDAVLQSAEDCDKVGVESPVDASSLRQKLHADKRLSEIIQWEELHSTWFQEGVIGRLGPSVEGEEQAFTRDLSFEDVWGDWNPGITTRISLHCHLAIRNAVPGIALFESDKDLPSNSALTAAKVLTLNIPKLKVKSPDEVLELRERAKKDINSFWEMIDYYNQQSTPRSAVEQIQKDMNKWSREYLSLKGKFLATAGLATLCFTSSVFLPAAALVGLKFLSKANIRWAERNFTENKGFRFVSALSQR
jgi:hypothetical protein